jgi:glutamyl-tRNA(Gln) amidotransferase subunit E
VTSGSTRYLPLEETPPSWYEEVGFTSGIEVHQQLLTRKKLFCRCPAGLYSHEWDAEILRHMRPTLSELGEYDGTALMEFRTRKQIVYQINKQTVCTYEFDDTPPFMINEEALDIAVEIALLLRLNIVSELHIARKQYLDGSIPTGFQRTTILGVDGWVPYRGRRIRIVQLGLEEDACREVSDVGHVRTYITDRLGMPLIETVTYPDMATPWDVAGVAEVIRRLNRCTGKMRTGSGAGREDVNVSVRGGRRCEIKGVSSIRRIPRLVHNEAFRQVALLEIRDELRQRGVDEARFSSKTVDVTERLGRTRFWPVLQALHEGRRARAVLLRGYEGLLRYPLGPVGKTFLQELSDRVRVVACIDLHPNMLCSDVPEGNLSPDEWQGVRRATGAGQGDAIVVVWGPEEDLVTACEEIADRARQAGEGVPNETRQALRDGTTGFERVLPGANRMYPDTDLPPKPLRAERVERIKAELPEPPWTRERRYRAAGVPEQLAHRLSISPRGPLFDRLGDALDGHPTLAAGLLADRLRHLQRRGGDVSRLDADFLTWAFRQLSVGRLVPDGIVRLVEHRVAGGDGASDELVDRLGLRPATTQKVDRSVGEVLEGFDAARFASPGAARRWAMGELMRRLRGRVDGAEAARVLEGRAGWGGA